MLLAVERFLERLAGCDVEDRQSCLSVRRDRRDRLSSTTTRAERRVQRDALFVAQHDDVNRFAGLVVLQRVGHVVQVLDARAGHFDERVAAFDPGEIGRSAAAHVGELHAAGRRLHRAVVGNRAEVGAVAAAVAFHRRSGRCARVRRRDIAARERRRDARRHLRRFLRAVEVDRIRVVFRRVIALVRAGEEVNDGNLMRVKARLIGRAVAVAARGDVEMQLAADAIEQRLPFRRGLAAKGDQLVVVHRADHVEVDHRLHVRERQRRMRDEIRRSAESDFFGREKRDDDRAAIGRVFE